MSDGRDGVQESVQLVRERKRECPERHLSGPAGRPDILQVFIPIVPQGGDAVDFPDRIIVEGQERHRNLVEEIVHIAQVAGVAAPRPVGIQVDVTGMIGIIALNALDDLRQQRKIRYGGLI